MMLVRLLQHQYTNLLLCTVRHLKFPPKRMVHCAYQKSSWQCCDCFFPVYNVFDVIHTQILFNPPPLASNLSYHNRRQLALDVLKLAHLPFLFDFIALSKAFHEFLLEAYAMFQVFDCPAIFACIIPSWPSFIFPVTRIKCLDIHKKPLP